MGRKKSIDVNSNEYKYQKIRVEEMCAGGCDETYIAKCLGVTRATLIKYFSNEITAGLQNAGKNVKAYLYRNCKKGNVVAQIFWLKAFEGVREADTNIQERAPITILFGEDERVNESIKLLQSAVVERTEKNN